MIELVKVLAWPVAGSIIAICLTIMVLKIFSRDQRQRVSVTGPKGFGVTIGRFSEEGATSTSTSTSTSTEVEVSDDLGARDPIFEAEDRSTPALTAEAPPADSQSDEPSQFDFAFTKDADKFHSLWEAFKNTDTYREDIEFWETHYISRQRDLGLGGTRSQYEALAESNPSWVWPLIRLIRDCAAQGEYEDGKALIAQALSRESPKHRSAVTLAAIDLHHELGERDADIRFVSERLSQGVPEAEAAAALEKLADLYKKDNVAFSYNSIGELALRLDPGNHKLRFNIAYKYGDQEEYLKIAQYHYFALDSVGAPEIHVQNNLGVAVSLSKPAQFEFWERSVGAGNALAACNLAQALADAGFLGRAEKLLDSFTDFSGFEENLAKARQKILAAKRGLDKDIAEIRDRSKTAFKPLKYIFGKVLKHICSGNWNILDGDYQSDAGELKIAVFGESAQVALNISQSIYTATLLRSGLCWEGIVFSGTTFLSSIGQRISIWPISERELIALTWSGSGSDPTQHYLTRSSESSAVQQGSS